MYKYETHFHTMPVSKCARATVGDSLAFYAKLGYDGVFLTNHFLDGNINIDGALPYSERLDFYFSDYESGVEAGKKLGIKVFLGVETSYKGTDFLIYGLDKRWFSEHPEIMEMKKSAQLRFMRESGAFTVQAHPFRSASYIDHIRLFPDCVDGVEVINAARTDRENLMARLYAEAYGLIMTAGSDNHCGADAAKLAGMEFDSPLFSEHDYIDALKNGRGRIFTFENA